MSTATRSRGRGTVIRVPDSNPGLLFVGNEQKAFTLEQIWKSPVAPAANMVVDVDLDAAGNIAAITAVDAQQLAKDRLNQISGVAQQQGKQAVEIAREGVGALAARMGKVALGATVAIWVAWFLLPAASLNLGFLGSKSFTFWDLLGIDPSNPMNMATGSSHGIFALIGLLAIAAPIAAPFVLHPRANYLKAMPLAFLVLMVLKVWWTVNQALGGTQQGARGEMARFTSEMAETAVKSMMDAISIGAGTYILVIASLILAAQAFKKRASA